MNESLTNLEGYIAPGAKLGVLGGGQLGRLFTQAANKLGYNVVVMDPEVNSPAAMVAQEHIQLALDDQTGLQNMVDGCAAITVELENVPVGTLEQLAKTRWVAPSGKAVALCQDRALEKAHFNEARVPCAPYQLIQSVNDLQGLRKTLLPGILKTTRLGYDGKGQMRVADLAAVEKAWQTLGQVPCVLEKHLSLESEISVIVARSSRGEMVHLPVQQNWHTDGVLSVTRVPAPNIAQETAKQAIKAAKQLAASLDYVGVLCVEFFVLQDGSLLANEMAPRPHNSGHYSLDACDISQFELQVRALTNAPLLDSRLHSSAIMINLLGDLWFTQEQERTPPWEKILALSGAHLYLYGKSQPRKGRKMGHLTMTARTPKQAQRTAQKAAHILGLPLPISL